MLPQASDVGASLKLCCQVNDLWYYRRHTVKTGFVARTDLMSFSINQMSIELRETNISDFLLRRI